MLTTGWSAAGERSQDLFSSEARLQNQTTFSKQLQKKKMGIGEVATTIFLVHTMSTNLPRQAFNLDPFSITRSKIATETKLLFPQSK